MLFGMERNLLLLSIFLLIYLFNKNKPLRLKTKEKNMMYTEYKVVYNDYLYGLKERLKLQFTNLEYENKNEKTEEVYETIQIYETNIDLYISKEHFILIFPIYKYLNYEKDKLINCLHIALEKSTLFEVNYEECKNFYLYNFYFKYKHTIRHMSFRVFDLSTIKLLNDIINEDSSLLSLLSNI